VSFPDRIAIASRNPGKIREIRSICADWPVEWITASSRPGAAPARARASGYCAKSAGVTMFTRWSVDCAERMVDTSN